MRELVRELARVAGVRPAPRPGPGPEPAPAVPLAPLRRVQLTDEVSRTLFGEYAAHRASASGAEEIGWDLLGVRQGDTALVLATLPAGEGRDASAGHVEFNRQAQEFAWRILRQHTGRLRMLGVAHTHPGSLRHPSAADYRGDVRWVENLKGQEGVFGIGTADAEAGPETGTSWQPASNVQCLGELRLTWYVLAKGDRNYRALPVELTIGRDLAAPLRPVWEEIEAHAERLDRLARQLSRVRFEVAGGHRKPALTLTVPLPDDGRAVRVELEGKDVRYRLLSPDGAPLAADLREDRVDVGVFHVLSELAAR